MVVNLTKDRSRGGAAQSRGAFLHPLHAEPRSRRRDCSCHSGREFPVNQPRLVICHQRPCQLCACPDVKCEMILTRLMVDQLSAKTRYPSACDISRCRSSGCLDKILRLPATHKSMRHTDKILPTYLPGDLLSSQCFAGDLR